MNQLEQRLSYSQTPLTADQSNQMVGILAATAPQHGGDQSGARANLMSSGLGGNAAQALVGNGGSRITDGTIAQAQGVLTGPQLDALKQLQDEQQAQAKMAQALRNQFGGSRPPVNPPPTTAGGPGGG